MTPSRATRRSSRLAAAALAGALVITTLTTGPPGGAATVESDVAPTRALRDVTAGARLNGMDVDARGAVHVATGEGEVRVFAPGAAGRAAPVRRISLGLTSAGTRYYPAAVAVDGAGRVHVVDYAPTIEVRVFAPGAHGDVAPERVFTGPTTPQPTDRSLTVGPDGSVYVVSDDDSDAGRIDVFAPGARGAVTPARTIRGGSTGLVSPRDVAVDSAGDVYVSEWNPGAVNVYGRKANGNVKPKRSILSAGLWQATRLDVGPGGKVFVGAYWGDKVMVFPSKASGEVPPANLVTGKAARIDRPWDVAVDRDGVLYVGNYGTNAVNVYAPLLRPSAVRGLAVKGKKKAKVRKVVWSRPADDGGRDLTGYDVTVRKGKKVLRSTSVGPRSTSLKIDRRHLRSGKHSVTVAARNAAGPGKKASRSFGVKLIKPAKVRKLTVKGGKAAKRRVVRWRAPVWDGGAPVKRYRVVVERAGDRTVVRKEVRGKAAKGERARLRLKKAQLLDGRHRVLVRAVTKKGVGPVRKKAFRVRQ